MLKFHSEDRTRELVRQAYKQGRVSSIDDARDIFNACLDYIGQKGRYTGQKERSEQDLFSLALATLLEVGRIQGIKSERNKRRSGAVAGARRDKPEAFGRPQN